MNFVKFLLTFTLLAMANVKVHCLECYVCTEDCDDHLNLRPQVCGASSTTTTTTPTTTTEATTTTTPTTTRQSTMGFSTSSIPPTSTVTTTTTAGTSTTTTDATTTSTTTTQPTTLYTGTPTTTAVTTTTTTYIPPTEGPEFPPTVIIPTDAPTTAAPTDAPTTEARTTNPTDAPSAGVRNRRSLSQKELAVNHLLQNYRSKSRQRRDTDASAWVCYAINKEDGESKTRVYGCVSIPQDETACQAIRNEVGLSSDADEDKYQCSYCFTDNCNGSATLKLSIVALAGVLLLKWLL